MPSLFSCLTGLCTSGSKSHAKMYTPARVCGTRKITAPILTRCVLADDQGRKKHINSVATKFHRPCHPFTLTASHDLTAFPGFSNCLQPTWSAGRCGQSKLTAQQPGSHLRCLESRVMPFALLILPPANTMAASAGPVPFCHLITSLPFGYNLRSDPLQVLFVWDQFLSLYSPLFYFLSNSHSTISLHSFFSLLSLADIFFLPFLLLSLSLPPPLLLQQLSPPLPSSHFQEICGLCLT